MNSSRAIGMFDSGIGGLTVMQQIASKMPFENIVYLGDTARLPYGEKSPDAILRYSIENTDFLLSKNIKVLVIACNTASAYAWNYLQERLSIPIVEVIRPGAQRATEVTINKKIAVLGTKATIRSGAYQREIQRLLPSATVFAVPCPLFVPLVEEKFYLHPAAKMIVKEYLHPLKEQGVDTILLGCTHYPLLDALIREEMGNVMVVDSATTCAEHVFSVLKKHQLASDSSFPVHRYFVSDDPEKFRLVGEALLGKPISPVEMVSWN